jgi:hypothetical protein
MLQHPNADPQLSCLQYNGACHTRQRLANRAPYPQFNPHMRAKARSTCSRGLAEEFSTKGIFLQEIIEPCHV